MEAEHMELILTGIGLLVIWVSSLVGFWIKMRLKIKEIEIMVENNKQELIVKCDTTKSDLEKHERWGENQQMLNDQRFKELIGENKNEHLAISDKIDVLLNNFNEFRIIYERQRKN